MSAAADRARAAVRRMTDALDAAPDEGVAQALAAHVAPGWQLQATHPWNDVGGPAEAALRLWQPLRAALRRLQRRPLIFFAGENARPSGGTWAVEMGHLMGLFDAPLLGLRPTRRMAFLAYADFHRVEGGRVAATTSFLDLPNLAELAGQPLLPPGTGAAILRPGPATADGLLRAPQPAAEGERTRALIAAMIEDLLARDTASPPDHLARFWTADMCWFGPGGIGASTGHAGYRAGHAGPWEEGVRLVEHHGHEAFLAEGAFGGFFGWPSMTVASRGGFLGLTAGSPAPMRVCDLYRRAGDRLAENWIFIDILHWLAAQDADPLERLARDLA